MTRMPFTRRLSGWIALAVASAFVLSQLLFQSTLAALGGNRMTVMAGTVTAASVAAGWLLVAFQGAWSALWWAMMMALLVFWQCQVFSDLTGYPTNYNIILSFAPMFAFPLFANPALRLNRLMGITFVAALAYCLIYVAANGYFVSAWERAREASFALKGPAGAAPMAPVVRVLPGDGARPPRVFLATMFSTFALFYALTQARETRRYLRWLTLAAIPAAAVFMAQSRTYSAILFLIAILYALRITGRGQRIALALVVLASLLILILGVAVPSWNPFGAFADDSSGAARARAYRVITRIITDHFVTGIGIAPSAKAQQAFIGEPGVFWSDLGVIGIWYTFGLAGLAVYCVQAMIVVVGVERPQFVSRPEQETLFLSGMVVGLTAWLTPDIWAGANGVLLSITMGMLLRPMRQPGREIAIWFGAHRVLFGDFGLRYRLRQAWRRVRSLWRGSSRGGAPPRSGLRRLLRHNNKSG